MNGIIRVFPEKNKWTPDDSLAFVGDPPLFNRPENKPVKISITFTWHKAEGMRLKRSWERFYSNVEVGGPAFGDPGGEFIPGMFLKKGVVITSRGCCWTQKKCPWCIVPCREGKPRTIEIKNGHINQDNNILCLPRQHIEAAIDMHSQQKEQTEFNGGIDTTLLKKWHVDLFKSISLKSMFFACDHQKAMKHLEKAADLLSDISQNKKRCYVLIGHDGETIQKAEQRLEAVFNLGFMPFSQLYQGEKKKIYPKVWTDLNRLWSRPAAYKSYMKPKEIEPLTLFDLDI